MYYNLLSGEENGRSLHYLNGINFSDLIRTQQCLPYGGSQQITQGGTGTAAVSQMVTFIRSMNLMTLNVAGTATTATTPGGGFTDPRMLPSLLVHTRPLSSVEASKLTNNAFTYGARIEPDLELGIPAKVKSPYNTSLELQDGDILLSVDGKNSRRVFRLRRLFVGSRCIKSFCGVLEKRICRTKTIEAVLQDGNADALVAGCYAMQFQKR